MATRFYFPASEAAAATPNFDGGWNYTSEALRRRLAKPKGSSAIAAGTQIGAWTAGQTPEHMALDRQYISDPIVGGTISGTAKGQLMVREHNNGDNVDKLICKAWVMKPDGTSRGTLLAIAHYGTAGEFINNVSMRNCIIANGDGLSSVDAIDGDRIVLEIGYQGTGTATPEASAKWGENATDLPENQTQTTDGAGWFEFSGTITILHQGAGQSDGTSTVAGAGVVVKFGAVAAAGAATVTGDGTVVESGIFGSGQSDGIATVTGTGIVIVYGAAASAGIGTVAGAGVVLKLGATQSDGAASVAGAGLIVKLGASASAGTSSLSGVGLRQILGTSAPAGLGVLQGAGIRLKLGAAQVDGLATVQGEGIRQMLGAGSVSGSGAAVVAGMVVKLGVSVIAGTSMASGSGLLLKFGTVTINGVATVQGAADEGFIQGSGTSEGTSTLSGAGILVRFGSATASCSSSASGSGTVEEAPLPPGHWVVTRTLLDGTEVQAVINYPIPNVLTVSNQIRKSRNPWKLRGDKLSIGYWLLERKGYPLDLQLSLDNGSLVSLEGAEAELVLEDSAGAETIRLPLKILDLSQSIVRYRHRRGNIPKAVRASGARAGLAEYLSGHVRVDWEDGTFLEWPLDSRFDVEIR